MAWRAQISHRLHELKILLAGETSEPINQHLKAFLINNYSDLKIMNPKFPFLVRNYKGAEPMIIGRYGFGHEEVKTLTGLTEPEIDRALQDLVKLGETYPKAWPITEELPPVVVNAITSEWD
mmetsp:Transcript_1033/g.3033  ORF Transcript_1033/g.3033 Transcript_1033/m.3033 type:complete len:122 (-) Transcript_1033:142-507(-)